MRTQSVIKFKVTHEAAGILIEPAAVYIDVRDAHKAKMLAASALRKAGIRDSSVVEQVSEAFANGLAIWWNRRKNSQRP